ncbi:MAG: flavodoxin family protein [Bacillota bacterium]
MRALGLVGSPRRGGYTDTLVSAVLAGAEAAGARCERLYLSDVEIGFCRHCDYCREHGACVLGDDMDRLGELFEAVDCLVLGAPTYYLELNALTKAFIDRCYQFTRTEVDREARRMKFVSTVSRPKRGAFVGVSGSYGPEVFEKQVRIVRSCFRHLNTELIGTLLVPYTDWMPGDHSQPPLSEALAEARALGHRLTEAAST